MALNTFKCNYLTPLHFEGLSSLRRLKELGQQVACEWHLVLSANI